MPARCEVAGLLEAALTCASVSRLHASTDPAVDAPDPLGSAAVVGADDVGLSAADEEVLVVPGLAVVPDDPASSLPPEHADSSIAVAPTPAMALTPRRVMRVRNPLDMLLSFVQVGPRRLPPSPSSPPRDDPDRCQDP
ncbi:hypothetical protein GCM10027599_07810 [Yimella radicis]